MNTMIPLCTLAIGNTHLSVARWSDGAQHNVASFSADRKGLQRAVAAAARHSRSVVVAGVVPRLKSQAVALLKKKRCDVSVFRKDILPEIEIVPEPSERVGDDRIAAALGALAIDARTPWVVVDVGTALTCNAVMPARGAKPPRFEGGLIVPGALMSLGALARRTAQLPALSDLGEPGEFQFIGRSTEQAMRWGVALSQVATLLAMVAGQRRALGPDTRVALTGGGAAAIKDAMRFAGPAPVDFVFHPALVHLGLFSAWKAHGRSQTR